MIVAWTFFFALAAVVAIAGSWLSHFGDVIGEKTGLSGSWVGLVLMATVTSLPELVTGVSSVRIVGSPDLAVADALGSCVFNLLLLSLADLFHRPTCMFVRASQGHVLSLGFSGILLGVVGLNIAAPAALPGLPVSWATVLIVPIYLLALRSTFTFERRQLLEHPEPTAAKYPGVTLRRAVWGYVVAALAVVAAGILLPPAATKLAEAMGWSDSFVGGLFLAAATSLPEAAVTLAAVRIGLVDMAFANLLGSNLFNVLVLALDDVAYVEGPLYSSVTGAHGATVLTALLMTGIVTAGLIYRSEARPAGAVSWASLALVVAFGVNAWLLATGQPRS